MSTNTATRSSSPREGSEPNSSRVPVIDYLLDAHAARRSGVIRAEQGKARKQLVLREGAVAFAESDVGDEHLARVLVRLGHLQRADLAKVTDAMKKGSTSEEAILAATSATRADVETGARELAVTVAASLMQCPADSLRFYPQDGPLHRALDLRLSPLTLILESVRRAVAERKVPPCFGVLRGMVRASREPGELRLSLPLAGAEAWAYSALHEPVACEEIASRVPTSGESPEELVKRLLLLGLVELETPRAADAEAQSLCEVERLVEDVVDRLAALQNADHYHVLGVASDATDDQTRAAYHDLARKYHPDRYQSQDENLRKLVNQLFTQITGAYSVLGDPVARLKHDEEIRKRSASDEASRDSRAREESESQKMAETLFRGGSLAHSKGEHDKAAGLFKECVRLQPKVSKYFYALGLAQSEVPRMRKDAEKNLLESIELQPTHAASHLALARLYILVNLPRRAEARLAELLTWDPGNGEARSLLAKIGGGGGN